MQTADLDRVGRKTWRDDSACARQRGGGPEELSAIDHVRTPMPLAAMSGALAPSLTLMRNKTLAMSKAGAPPRQAGSAPIVTL